MSGGRSASARHAGREKDSEEQRMSERRQSTNRVVIVVAVTLAAAVVVSVLLFALFSGGIFEGAGYTTSRNSDAFPVSGGYSVAFRGGSTDLHVLASTNGTVYLTVTVTSYILGVHPSVNITSTFSQNEVNFNVTTPWGGLSHSVSSLYLPGGVAAGNVSVAVSNGNVVMTEPATSVSINATTSNGNIEVTASSSSGIHLLTDNGNINFASQSFLNLTAITENGNINLQVIGSVITPGTADLATTNGNIQISVNPSQSVGVDVSTGVGTVSVSGLQFTSTSITPRAFSGILGTGEATLHAVTVNGNIEISS